MAASYAMIVLGFNAVETVVLVLAFGALVGAINAFLIVKLKVPDLLATLAIMFLLTGLQLIPTAGRSISVGLILPDGTTATGKVDPSFLLIGRSSLFGVIPVPVILMILVALALFVLTERTRLGRLLYATGGNEVAARLAGATQRASRPMPMCSRARWQHSAASSWPPVSAAAMFPPAPRC